MRIYVAGKNLERARRVMEQLRSNGHIIAYDWATEYDDDNSQERAIAEAEALRSADVLVYLWEFNQESARYAAGIAMGLNKPLIVSGKSDSFFFSLPNVHCVFSDKQAIEFVESL